MEIQLSEERQSQLEAAAKADGKSPAVLASEALTQYLDHREWIARAISEGRAAADRGDFIDHDDVGRMLNERFGSTG